jgi:hypothetical protein
MESQKVKDTLSLLFPLFFLIPAKLVLAKAQSGNPVNSSSSGLLLPAFAGKSFAGVTASKTFYDFIKFNSPLNFRQWKIFPCVLNCPLRFNIDSHFSASKLALIFQKARLPVAQGNLLMAASSLANMVGSSGRNQMKIVLNYSSFAKTSLASSAPESFGSNSRAFCSSFLARSLYPFL